MQALREENVPEYLCRIVASYFTDRVLKYDTKNGLKEYDITGGVPQGSVLGPLLWNIMYDGLLRLKLPRSVKLVEQHVRHHLRASPSVDEYGKPASGYTQN
ncbi:uncharacterized protein LOC123269324 [Cotesia glomerata]|uniref:uncharacterized protein LOC123269324 n=1 Tax=Cotesia glomerata TaxID=32391 RepID=UPI001D02DC72|nr:uncharacterized protein LOC123269324 [Cotesia glomerata]